MDSFGFALMFFGAFIGLPLFYYFFYEPLRILLRVVFLVLYARLNDVNKDYLAQNFTFYKSLSEINKQRFERRVALFLRYKKFTGIDILVTEEMKVFVSACAVQLTFGLRNFWITEFDEFRITKESYQLENYSRKAMGHVSNRGTITLAWNRLLEGYNNPSDGINVGLHEIAHALMISSTEKGWNLNFAVEFHNWERIALIEWKRHRSNHTGALREYAYSNLYELFAVAVEYFFEKSAELKNAAPELYQEMIRLLRLDPMNAPDPIAHHSPVVYPSQPIPLPKYGLKDIANNVFESARSFITFLIGTATVAAGIYCIRRAILLEQAEDPYNDVTLWVYLGALLFLLATFCYISVFYRGTKSE